MKKKASKNKFFYQSKEKASNFKLEAVSTLFLGIALTFEVD